MPSRVCIALMVSASSLSPSRQHTEKWRLPYLLGGPFDLDVGRTQLAPSSEANLTAFRVLGEMLRDLAAAEASIDGLGVFGEKTPRPERLQRLWNLFLSNEVVDRMLKMAQVKADDYVIATGETHTVREFLEETFALLDLNWKRHVEIDPRYFRPAEVDVLCGDMSKAKRILRWEPRVHFKELCQIMVAADMKLAEAEAQRPRSAGRSRD